jgi:IS30 family transposase
MTHTKSDTPVLRSRGLGVGWRPHTGKIYTAEKAQEKNSGRCQKRRLKREKDYELRMKVGRRFKEDESEKLEREL